jgi:penicillin amidase
MPSLRILRTVAGITAGIATGVAGLALAAFKRPLPRTNGALRLGGLQAPVNVLRDCWGVPHIYAEHTTDLFMAQGYVHAQDRLWQMEFQRRIGHGRLAELVGAIALDTDRYMRVLGLSRIAARETNILAPEAHAALQAYAAGVNAYIDQHTNRLPIEFTILQCTPEPWQMTDSLVWAKIMALNLSGNWSSEILRARMIATLGAERANQLSPEYPSDHPLIVPEGASYQATLGEDILHLADGATAFIQQGSGQGSNNWVVNGQHSATGQPLLANDPHLSIAMPSVWYENHLCGGPLHVAGASFPGSPGVVIGHNERIAWGVTNGMNDVQDLYLERFDPADPTRYRFQDTWQPAEIIREEIHVKGQTTAHTETVRVTHHGPIISPLLTDQALTNHTAPEEALALRWTALEPSGGIVASILGINRASDWHSFRNALADWNVPPQNFVYADVDGHIGYALGGDIPVRAKGDGRLPVPGWTGEYEWTGVVPHAELPHILDPHEGFAISANNRIVSDAFPHSIPGEYLNGYRAARIRTLIEQTDRHSPQSFARIHADKRCLPGLALAALAGRLPTPNAVAQAAQNTLAAWDGEMSSDSVAATIYTVFSDCLLAVAYAEAKDLFDMRVGVGAFASIPIQDMFNRAIPSILRRATELDNSWLPAGQTWQTVLEQAWETALSKLQSQYGDVVAEWRYGRDHTLTIRHPLGAVPVLGRLFNRGPFPTGGNIDTVCMGNLPRVFAGQPFYVAPSYRQILDVSDWNRSKSIHPTGQSGHPASRHYADFIKPWLNIEYHQMPWSRNQVDEATTERLTLQP